LLFVDERLEISGPIGILSDFFECVSLLSSPLEELTGFVRVDATNVHLLSESTAIEGGGVDVAVPHQV
jgi:hypothetical protein